MVVTNQEKSLYDTLNISKSSNLQAIRKAYYREALKYHPDRTGNTECEQFKKISRAYEILSNETLKEKYDLFGIIDDNSINSNDITEKFKNMFSRVTLEEIDIFKKDYIGSVEEFEDLLAAYVKNNGSMELISDNMFFGCLEAEERYKQILERCIARGILKKCGDFTLSTSAYKKTQQRRKKKQEAEAKEAAKLAKELKIDTDKDLRSAIISKQQKNNSFLDDLEARYSASTPNQKKRKVN